VPSPRFNRHRITANRHFPKASSGRLIGIAAPRFESSVGTGRRRLSWSRPPEVNATRASRRIVA
jgi:hypothetical protein